MSDADGGDKTGLETGIEGIIRAGLERLGADPDEVERAFEEHTGSETGTIAGVSSGIAYGLQLSEARRAMRDAAEQVQGDEPPVQVREIERDGEFVGLRVLCSDPDATLYASDGEILVRGAAFERTIPVEFEVDRVEDQDADAITEYVVHAEGERVESPGSGSEFEAVEAFGDDEPTPAEEALEEAKAEAEAEPGENEGDTAQEAEADEGGGGDGE